MKTHLIGAIFLISACGEDPAVDAGPDAQRPDGGDRLDAARPDAAFDAGPDTARADGGRTDGGPRDAGSQACGSLTLPALTYEDVLTGSGWEAYYPVGLVQPPGETEDLYVLSQDGRIVIVRDGAIAGTFLDLTSTVDFGSQGDERGLLGLAFHPDYQANGRFFVYYTSNEAGQLRNVLAEYTRSGNPDVANDTEVTRLIDLEDPQPNHNGGGIVFGPDGFLYVGIGDGGGAGDQHGDNGNGQDLDSAFGKLHRLDVDAAASDYVASGNPFASGSVPTIWAYGLRNPWRFSFDRANGDLYLGDVGESQWEEINLQPASSSGGENYGWARFEGFDVFRADVQILPTGTTPVEPVLAYDHAGEQGITPGLAVTGGYVYRGTDIPELQGWYLFGDYLGDPADGNDTPVAAFRYCEGGVAGVQLVPVLTGLLSSLASFGEDNAGELYLVGSSVVKITRP
jgi:glucose/arabinose dehydrogenase